MPPEQALPNYKSFHYIHIVHFNSSIGEYIEAGNIENDFKQQLKNQGNQSTITNFTAVKTSDNTLTIEYDATSPPVVIAIIAVAAVLIAIFIYLTITSIETSVKGLIAEGVNPSTIFDSLDLYALLGLGVVIAGLVLIYKYGK